MDIVAASGELERVVVLLGNTLGAFGVALPVALLLGGALGVLTLKTDAHLSRLSLVLLIFAACLPLYVVNEAIIALLDSAEAGTPRLRGSLIALGIVHGIAHAPLVGLVLGLAARSVDRGLEERALVDGLSGPRAFLRVTLPGARGALGIACLIVLLSMLGDFSASDRLLVRTFAEEIYTQFQAGDTLAGPLRSALPPVVLGLVGIALVVRRIGLPHADSPAARESTAQTVTAGRYSLGAWRWPAGLAALGVCAVLALGPLAFFLGKGFLVSGGRGKGLPHYARVFWPELSVSISTGFTAACIAAALALPLAWILVRSRRWRWPVGALLALLLALPGPLLGIGLVALFNRPGIAGSVYDSPAMLVIAYTLRFLPIAVLVFLPSAGALPSSVLDAARLDGLSEASILRRVVLPHLLPAALLAICLVAALSVGELPASLLVTPPGYETVGKRFFNLIHYGQDGEAGALCTLALLLVAVPVLGIVVLSRRRLLR